MLTYTYSKLTTRWEDTQTKSTKEFQIENTTLVKYIGQNAADIVVPEGITKIGDNAFRSCKTAGRVVLPSTLVKIGYGAFAGCDISNFKTEEGSAFKVVDGCLIDVENKKLIAGCTKSKIPDDGSVTSIAAAAFCGYDFGDGQSILIPFAITIIEENAFTECSHLHICCKVDEYDEPEGWAEQWYTHPEPWEEDLEDENYIPVIEWDCLTDEERAEKERILREKAEAEEKFRLSQANDYVRENGVMSRYVGQGRDVVIPPDVKIILRHSFDGCSNVSSVKIHYFVSFVEEGTFDVFKGTDVQFFFQADNSPQGFNDNRFKRDNLHFGCIMEQEREQVEKELSRRKTEELAMRGFEVQGEYLRKYNGSEECVVLPYSDVSTVDKGAFKGNAKIKTVCFGTVDKIWDGAFENCPNLEKVVLPDTVTSLHSSVFRNCEKLNIERFPVLTREIGALALSNTAQEDICLNLRFVGNGAFSDCKKLKKAVINNDGNCAVRWQAFYGCYALKEVELNFDSREIEWGTFEGCRSLNSVTFPRGLKIIGAMAFKDCAPFNFQLPDTLTEIGDQAFLNCGRINELLIPCSVSKIGNGAFMGCTFKSITLPKIFLNDMERIFGRREPDPFGLDEPAPIIKFI